MTDQWFYRMFGHDFGPIDFEELKLLAQQGALSSSDEVRASDSSQWVNASSVGELNLEGDSTGGVATAVMPAPSTSAPAGADDWFCQFHGQELGPLGFDEIVAFVEQGQLAADDEVRLGAAGKWRRVGSIGRLVAVLPFAAVEAQIPEPKKAPTPTPAPVAVQPEPARQPAPVPAPAVAANNAAAAMAVAAATAAATAAAAVAAAHVELGHAQSGYAATDQSARGMIQWAMAPHVDPSWWGWIGGVEYGPLGFLQIYELGVSGRLQRTDFVKNGMYGQYIPVNNVPGLFNAVEMMKQAGATLIAAKSKVAAATAEATRVSQAAAALAPPPAPKAPAPEPVKASSPAPAPAPAAASKPAPAAAIPDAVKTPEVSKPASSATVPIPAVETPAPQPRPAPSPMSMSNSFAASPAPRPMPAPARSKSSSSSFSISDLLQDPKMKGVLGLVAAALLVVGWMYMPGFSSSVDIARYRELKKFLDDVRAARTAKGDMSGFKARAEKLKADYVAPLKAEAGSGYPAKQNLLWAVRDELPRMMGADLAEESTYEKAFAARLKSAADKLRIQ